MLAAALIGPAAVVGGALRFDGGRDSKLEEVTRRVDRLETDRRGDADRLSEFNQRMARVETKLDMLLTARGAAQ